ncbi:MAG: peptide chain release factor N(5)-glutamine methyltransferase [Pseudolabrys sp.]
MTAHFHLSPAATITQARRALTDALRGAGIESADVDARLLIGEALGLDHAALVSRSEDTIAPDHIAAIEAFAARRLAREPVSRIIGRREFWSLPLKVTPDVLVPRADTETLVERALDHIVKNGLRAERLRLLDIGTGTGALLLALLSELPNAIGIGTDLSPAAVAIAEENARALELAARASFVTGSYAAGARGPFDIIMSNPPYIARAEIDTLAPEVRDHDPRLALDGGNDGLDAYRGVIAEARPLLTPGGRLILELGAGQAPAVTALVEATGLVLYGEPQNDLAGIPRALAAGLPAPEKAAGTP